MRELFARINQEITMIETDRSPLSKDYATQLFKGTPWFLANLVFETETVVEPPAPTSEKVEVLKALEDFAREKTDKGEKPFVFEGGTIQFSHVDGNQVMTFDEEIPHSLSEYESSLSHCALCPEAAIAKRNFVVSEYSVKSLESPLKVLFLGDYPKNIPEKKECFIGEGGELLRKMISAMKLTDKEYACSLSTKCFRSSEDQKLVDEMAQICLKHFYRELILLKPQVVIALGTVAANLLLSNKERMAQIHGKTFTQKILFKNAEHEFTIVPTFHPDFLVSSPANKKAAWEDLQKVMRIIGKIQ